MDKIKGGKGARPGQPDRDPSSRASPQSPPRSATRHATGRINPAREQLAAKRGLERQDDADESERMPPPLTREEEEAQRRAFPELFRFFDELAPDRPQHRHRSQHQQQQQQRDEDEQRLQVHGRIAQATSARTTTTTTMMFADDETEEDEERWDASVRFDDDYDDANVNVGADDNNNNDDNDNRARAEGQAQAKAQGQAKADPARMGVSDEEFEAMTEVNEMLRRINAPDERGEDDLNEDPTVLLFRHLDRENELMRIQHEHVSNMPEYIGYEEEFEAEDTRIRREWMEDPRPVTAEHARELWDKLEAKRQELWDKYTTQAAYRFTTENYEELVRLRVLAGEENEDDGDEEDEERKRKLLRTPFARLLDPTTRDK